MSGAIIEELVVISGKGGTGKTSLTASFAVLAGNPVIADCDVDAADLHLVLAPGVRERHEFRGGHEAVIRMEECAGCGICLDYCRFDAVKMIREPNGRPSYAVDQVSCEGCGVCVRFCPARAIDFTERVCGEWMVSATRCGPMIHARLGLAAENSGKLVSIVRREARRIAEDNGIGMIIVDGPPGIGCPVISSLTGASIALVVTEPTVSGEHDLERILALAKHFSVPTAVCVNKWDINPSMTERIEKMAGEADARTVGRIRYDSGVTRAQLRQLAVVETDAPSADDIRHVWDNLVDLNPNP
ncbi:MAG TPA: ATP-binding protein [Geobacteraceae bacterium]|nr:ATP-binding protein [Geobacteraceae bacterium]